MKNIYVIFFGVLLCVALSFTGLILSSQIRYGDLEPVANEDGGVTFPRQPSGIALQGKQVYIDQGCIYCHTQQTRPKGFGADFERGWGNRQSVARDYILQQRVLLGTMRTGPDLMDVGSRLSTPDWHHLHLYNPRIVASGSVMPAYPYLYITQKIQKEPSPKALQFPPKSKYKPAPGYEVVPTERAEALVAYLLSLKLDYELPESKFYE